MHTFGYWSVIMWINPCSPSTYDTLQCKNVHQKYHAQNMFEIHSWPSHWIIDWHAHMGNLHTSSDILFLNIAIGSTVSHSFTFSSYDSYPLLHRACQHLEPWCLLQSGAQTHCLPLTHTSPLSCCHTLLPFPHHHLLHHSFPSPCQPALLLHCS